MPTRTLTGMRPPRQTELACRLGGSSDPWNGDADRWDKDPARNPSPSPEPSLAALYGSSAGYVVAARRSADALVALGFLRPADVAVLVEKAKAVPIR